MRYRIAVIAVITGLLVNGCSSGGGSETELADYKFCLENQASIVANWDRTTPQWFESTSEGGAFYNSERGRRMSDNEIVYLLCLDRRP